MLKLSLGLRITNSRRENLRKELHRGVEVHRLLRGGLAKQWQAAHPGFDIVRDPAWLAVDDPDGDPVPGLDVMIRHNPFAPGDDVSCIAGLVSPRPRAPWPARPTRDRRPSAVPAGRGRHPARRAGPAARAEPSPPSGSCATWNTSYGPCSGWTARRASPWRRTSRTPWSCWTRDGWPVGGRYRDNQGYYFRESRRAELDARLPGIGAHSDTFVSDEVTDERFAYYLGINNVLGLIGAFGSQRLADEQLLLAAFRRFLDDVASGPPGCARRCPAAARLTRPALQGQSAHPAARPRRARRPGRHPVRLRHHRQPPSS